MSQPASPPADSGQPATPSSAAPFAHPASHTWIAVLIVLAVLCANCYLILRYFEPAKDSPVHLAAKKGDLVELERLLKEDSTRANQEISMAATPIHWAAAAGQLEAVKLLVRYGADPNRVHKIAGTALHAAVRYNHGAVAEWLVGHGAAINAGDPSGRTALYVAVFENKPAMVELLLKLKADGTIPNHNGATPLGVALVTRNQEIADMLRAAGIKN